MMSGEHPNTREALATDQQAPWYWRLWVRLTSKRATRAEIDAADVSPEEMDRAAGKLMKRMDEIKQDRSKCARSGG